ncbi:Mur ligase domain-containing protein, partial [Thermodesulfobacteriota bacterium]
MQASQPIPWTTAEILEATKGNLLCGDIQHVFSGISIDSRGIAADDLFVAIKGQVHDGHTFIPAVIGNGIQGVIVNQSKAGDFLDTDWGKKGTAIIAVKETTKALG